METIQLKGSLFITVKEIMTLTGKDHLSKSQYENSRKSHKAIRDAISPNKRLLTVKEYCDYQGIPYFEVVEALNEFR